MKNILLGFISLFLIFSSCKKNPYFSELKENEVAHLTIFFETLFQTSTAGYVLFGNKPVFLCSFHPLETIASSSPEYRDSSILTNGLKAWDRLEIKGKNYLLCSYKGERGSQEIIIVNIKAFKRVFKNNLSLFKFKLGYQINEEILVNKIRSQGFSNFLKGQEALQGILLGYGTENAITYERGNALRKAILNEHQQNPSVQMEITEVDALTHQMIEYAKTHGGSWEEIMEELSDFSFYSPTKEEKLFQKFLLVFI